MEALFLKQEDISEHLSKAYTNYKKSPEKRLTPSYMESRLENLNKMWECFSEVHYKIVEKVDRGEKSKLPYFTSDVYTTVEDIYTEYKARLKDDLQRRGVTSERTTQIPSNAVSMKVKLPEIKLPTFSGNYEEWQTFNDMFLSLIHNNPSLSEVQKMHYLKGSLSGEPEKLLRNLATTDSNYEEAWSQLTRRYDNKRYNANEIMKRLFSQKNLTFESSSAIKQLLDTTCACIKSLNNIGIATDGWDPIINHLVVSKLDHESRKQWEIQTNQVSSNELQSWSELITFLETRFRTLEIIDSTKPASRPVVNPKPALKQKSFHASVNAPTKSASTTYNVTCPFCSSKHLLYQCKNFEKKSAEERSEFVQSNRLCFNCFAPTHSVRFCHQPTSCRKCGRRHHTLLHFEKEFNQDSTSKEFSAAETKLSGNQQSNQETERVVAHFAKGSCESEVLLATAMVKIESANGYTQIDRALVDQGSEASFVSEATVQSLGLKRERVNGVISGVGEGETRTKSMVTFNLKSLCDPEFSMQINAYVLSTLTSFLPSCKMSIENWPEIQNLTLADPTYGSPGKIDVILGVDVHSEIILQGLQKHPSCNSPVAQQTSLGWLLSGRILKDENVRTSSRRVINLHLKVKEDDLLKQFWEIEREPDTIKKWMTEEEKKCEEIYEKTTTRNSEGRYVVRLPFKGSNTECLKGNMREIALKRFKLLEKKLLRSPKAHEEYTKRVYDYIDQNHMEKIIDEKDIHKPNVLYLPHHAVVREDKDTTKVRVVYDASCKGKNNVSLNDELLVGPKLQQDLRHILLRWRCHKICIVADLVQRYRQIIVHNLDTDFQRIYWRSNTSEPIQPYRLLRLTFGTACAPYLAVKSLHQLAIDEGEKFPVVSNILLKDFYMDDLLTGCESDSEAILILDEVSKLLSAGGFTLQKWCTNSDRLTEHIKKKTQSSTKSVVFKENDVFKILGISWNKTNDKFEYNLNLPEDDEAITKRKVLSYIARIYDPMGWIAPVVITAKLFIQKLWKSGLAWDDILTSELLKEWSNFKEDLLNISLISIPRWLDTIKGDNLELHAFADASQAAFAAVVYIKVKRGDTVHIRLVTSKTKVAPIEREISIPRLELCASVLAAKLLFEVSQVLEVSTKGLFLWTDSTIVLAWLRGETSRWATFVSNRVSEIKTILDSAQWGHVDTHQNPADCASRGLSIIDLHNHSLWWHGPEFLFRNSIYDVGEKCYNFETDLEERGVKTLTAVVSSRENFIWTRFSDLTRCLRVLSYCKKNINLKLPKEQRLTLNKRVTTKEMSEILKMCIRETQEFYFGDEIKQLKSQGHVFKRSQLHTLSPTLDESGILRVGGRLQRAQVEYDMKHPIIMPAESHLTRLLVLDAHTKTLHGGPQIMLNYLRAKFWIIRARNLVRKCYRECATCLRYSRQNNNKFMGELPEPRVSPMRTFEASGVDFTGHINIRFSPGRGSKSYKGYICLFVCMSSKAVHLEAVSDLSAQGFIAAFRRFVSRRGHCRELFSDNGTNFVGANKELRNMFNKAVLDLPEEISDILANEGTTWHFIPPHAPNFGGLWEAGVRSAKNHLKRVIGDATLTFEELSTVLSQVEACLNSRPLSYISENPGDPLPLTPGHFLIGEPLVIIPDEDYSKINVSGLQRWKHNQKMINDFWRKWSEEYLVTLNQRQKWTTKGAEPDVNDVVIIKDQNLPPAKWLLGKIMEKHTGRDNITRVVTVKTKNGLLKRPCNKLCFLPKSE